MKKTGAAFFAVIAGTMVITGCNNTTEQSYMNETTTGEATTQTTTTEEPQPVISQRYPIIIGNSGMFQSSQIQDCDLHDGYYEDRAWVYFLDDSGEINFALIDTDGKILWERKQKDVPIEIITYPMQSGVSYYRDNSHTNIDECKSGFTIIDKDGKELYISEETEEEEHYLLCQYKDTFIVGKNVKTFSENKNTIYKIDKNGNKISDEIEVEKLIDINDMNLEYNSYFSSSDDSIYDILCGHFVDVSYCLGEKNELDKIFLDLDKMTVEAITEEELINIKNKSINFENGGLSPKDDGYYDNKNKKILEYPVFPDNVYIERHGYFKGGYAPLVIEGADEKKYITIIDSQGETQYEPVKVDAVLEDAIYDNIVAANGYVFVSIEDETKVIDPEGKILTPGSDDLSGIGADTQIPGFVTGGFLRMSNLSQYKDYRSEWVNTEDALWGGLSYYGFVSLDGEKIISTADEYQ